MNEFKVGDCLYNPKRGSKYIVVDVNEYNKHMQRVFKSWGRGFKRWGCVFKNVDGNLFMTLRALTPAPGLHLQGEYIVICRERINNPDYSSDLDNTYEKIEI
jgi:hypothetical protein